MASEPLVTAPTSLVCLTCNQSKPASDYKPSKVTASDYKNCVDCRGKESKRKADARAEARARKNQAAAASIHPAAPPVVPGTQGESNRRTQEDSNLPQTSVATPGIPSRELAGGEVNGGSVRTDELLDSGDTSKAVARVQKNQANAAATQSVHPAVPLVAPGAQEDSNRRTHEANAAATLSADSAAPLVVQEDSIHPQTSVIGESTLGSSSHESASGEVNELLDSRDTGKTLGDFVASTGEQQDSTKKDFAGDVLMMDVNSPIDQNFQKEGSPIFGGSRDGTRGSTLATPDDRETSRDLIDLDAALSAKIHALRSQGFEVHSFSAQKSSSGIQYDVSSELLEPLFPSFKRLAEEELAED
ncbi:hypothetical protein C8F04DRAFT_1117502 [Mycena alexandri]|uniref:Uncharacterized protein n=1 Tax=Mycena alexandri TaxID=1745969 RepID=A0AAD6WVN7_9AGAR|nr:hypothetical protein C8F04DRAFT_1117502 [Mycena alexandri]